MPNLNNLTTQDVQWGAALWNKGFKNYLINGDFAINQRAFAGGALAAGVYGFDRWKAGTGGCSVSLSAGVLTHTSGPLVQVIEAPNLAGKTITVSVEGLSGGSLNVTVEGVTGVIAAAAGRAGVSIAAPGASTGNVTVTLTPASGAVTYQRVQVETGSAATAFEWRPAQVELALCGRYFEPSYPPGYAPGSVVDGGKSSVAVGGTSTTGNLVQANVLFPVRKRAAPAVTIFSPATGSVGKVRDNNAGADVTGTVGSPSPGGFIWWGTTVAGPAGVNASIQWTADAEL
jgi:hypothetical protein